VHAADRDALVAELDGRVREAGAEDVLAEAAAGGCGAGLAAFGLVGERGDAELVSGNVSSDDLSGI
jgi:hypothetical protein